jgi:glycerol-3-phosphate dehydrogenase
LKLGIIGAGIVGLQTAYHALKNNFEVTIYEQSSSLGYGASGHNAGVLHVLQPPFINRKARMAKKANPLYNTLSQELGFRVRRLPLFLVYKDTKGKIFALAAGAILKTLGYQVSTVGKEEVMRECIDINKDISGALKVEGYGTVHPLEVLDSLARWIEDHGGEIRYSEKVVSVEENKDNVCIHHSGISQCFDKVVITAGPGVRDIYSGYLPRIGFYKGVMVYTKLDCNAIIAPVLSKTRSQKTKGGGVIPLPDGRVLLGPSFSETSNPWDTTATVEEAIETVKIYLDLLSYEPDILGYTAGTRAKNLSKDDFYIHKRKNVIVTAGIDSPGFTASPLIAQEIIRLASFP